jgi:hypothetical protein
VLKKVGIIVAATTAGVLAFSPLAFAGDKHDADKHYGKKDDKGHSRVVENNTVSDNVTNDCQFGNSNGDTSQGLLGGSSLLGAVAAPLTGVVANATDQVNLLNCTNVNVSDVFDSNSNNDSATLNRRSGA